MSRSRYWSLGLAGHLAETHNARNLHSRRSRNRLLWLTHQQTSENSKRMLMKRFDMHTAQQTKWFGDSESRSNRIHRIKYTNLSVNHPMHLGFVVQQSILPSGMLTEQILSPMITSCRTNRTVYQRMRHRITDPELDRWLRSKDQPRHGLILTRTVRFEDWYRPAVRLRRLPPWPFGRTCPSIISNQVGLFRITTSAGSVCSTQSGPPATTKRIHSTIKPGSQCQNDSEY